MRRGTGQRRAAHRMSAMTKAAPVAMAMVGKPRTSSVAMLARLKRGRRRQGDVGAGDGHEDERRGDDHGQQIAAAHQDRAQHGRPDQAREGDQAQAHAHEERVDGRAGQGDQEDRDDDDDAAHAAAAGLCCRRGAAARSHGGTPRVTATGVGAALVGAVPLGAAPLGPSVTAAGCGRTPAGGAAAELCGVAVGHVVLRGAQTFAARRGRPQRRQWWGRARRPGRTLAGRAAHDGARVGQAAVRPDRWPRCHGRPVGAHSALPPRTGSARRGHGAPPSRCVAVGRSAVHRSQR